MTFSQYEPAGIIRITLRNNRWRPSEHRLREDARVAATLTALASGLPRGTDIGRIGRHVSGVPKTGNHRERDPVEVIDRVLPAFNSCC
jgi:hypothetical protein